MRRKSTTEIALEKWKLLTSTDKVDLVDKYYGKRSAQLMTYDEIEHIWKSELSLEEREYYYGIYKEIHNYYLIMKSDSLVVIINKIEEIKSDDDVIVKAPTYNYEIQKFKDYPAPAPYVTNRDICSKIIASTQSFDLPNISFDVSLLKDLYLNYPYKVEIESEMVKNIFFNRADNPISPNFDPYIERPKITNNSIKITKIIR